MVGFRHPHRVSFLFLDAQGCLLQEVLGAGLILRFLQTPLDHSGKWGLGPLPQQHPGGQLEEVEMVAVQRQGQ